MSHKFLFNASFHLLLNTMDHELAEEVRNKGCDEAALIRTQELQ